MSCTGCCFESGTGLFPESDTTPTDFTETSNILYNEILFYSNINYKYASNISSNISSNITSNVNSNVNYILSNNSNIIYNNSNFSNLILTYINKDFNNKYIYFNNISTQTRIDSNGFLNVYHTSNILVPQEPSSWWNVEDKITSNMIETNLLKFDFSLLQSALTSLTTLLSTIQSELSALEASDVALTTSMVVIEQQIQSFNAIIAGLDLTV